MTLAIVGCVAGVIALVAIRRNRVTRETSRLTAQGDPLDRALFHLINDISRR